MRTQTAQLTTALPTAVIPHPGGRSVAFANGAWGGGAITVLWSTDKSNWISIGSGVSLSSATPTQLFEMPNGFLQYTLSGSTGATLTAGSGLTGGYS